MLAKRAYAKQAHLLIPGIAVAILYTALCAVPQHRELRQVQAASQEQLAAVGQLDLRLRAVANDSRRGHSDPRALLGMSEHGPTARTRGSLAREEPTFVQAFARVIAIFRSQAVACTAAKSDRIDQSNKLAITQRISLTGSFANVLAAMERIEAELPQALVSEFSMQRVDPSDPCSWEIGLCFSGGTE